MDIAPDLEVLATVSERLDKALRRNASDLRPIVAGSYALGVLSGMIMEAAETHGPTCKGCAFCDFLSRGLAVVSAHHLNAPELAGLDRAWKRDP
jgi:hypothetical protein